MESRERNEMIESRILLKSAGILREMLITRCRFIEKKQLKTGVKKKTRRNDNKYDNQQKKRTCGILDFAVPVELRVKLKESEKKEKYLNLARELKN